MEITWIIFLFLIGACVGSFLNVVIWRLPRGQSIVFPASHCPKCGRGIKWYDNLPIVSWCVLRGKCRFCKVPISPRYLLIELTTAILVAGLYVCYFGLDIRTMDGNLNPLAHGLTFTHSWPMFVAHAALLCGLLVCAAVDIELWLVPLEVTWVVAAIGVASATYLPHPYLTFVSPRLAAMAVAAVVGLLIAILLVRMGLIRPSFADVEDKPVEDVPNQKAAKGKSHKAPKPAPVAVAITAADGVNVRKEILRELIFLAPAIILAFATYQLLEHVIPARNAWAAWFEPRMHPELAPHLCGAAAAVFGYLVAGALVWGVRIVGTLAFGKEAMGLGDVHILAAVGAVTGWIVPVVAFFVAPVMGLIWAVYLFFTRKQRELPYGPWLAAAAVIVMLGFDLFGDVIRYYAQAFR